MTVVAAPAAAPRRLVGEDLLMRAGIVALAALLLLFIALPLATLLLKSFQDSAGHFVGLSNYGRYFATPTLVASLWNSLGVAVITTAIVVPLAYLYAYGLTSKCLPGKRLLAVLSWLPLLAPSLMPA